MAIYRITTATTTLKVRAMTMCLACAKFRALTRNGGDILKAELLGNN